MISRQEFQCFCRELKIDFSDKKWKYIFADIDRDGSGQITFQELNMFLFPDDEDLIAAENRRLNVLSKTVHQKSKLSSYDSQKTSR